MSGSFELQPFVSQAEQVHGEVLKARDLAFAVAVEEGRSVGSTTRPVAWWDEHLRHLGLWRTAESELIKSCDALYDLYRQMSYALSAEGAHRAAGSFEIAAEGMRESSGRAQRMIYDCDVAAASALDLRNGAAEPERSFAPAFPGLRPEAAAQQNSDGGIGGLLSKSLELLNEEYSGPSWNLDNVDRMSPAEQLRGLEGMRAWYEWLIDREERLLDLDDQIIALRKKEREQARTEVARAEAKHERVLRRLAHARPDEAELITFDVEIAEIDLESAQNDLIDTESTLREEKADRKERKAGLRDSRERLEEIEELIASL